MKNCIAMIFACAIIAAIGSCRKQTGINQNLNPDNQKPYDFMSTKNGSYWRYGSRSGVSYTRYARDKDTMKNNLKFSYYERHEDSAVSNSPEFFGKNNEYYFTLLDLDGTETSYLEYAYWKDSAKQGDSWNNTGSVSYSQVGTVSLLTQSYETEEGLTLSFGGATYTDVVHVHSDIKATLLNAKIGTLDVWFVKSLGVIREEANINVFGAYKQSHTDSLLSYHIEP